MTGEAYAVVIDGSVMSRIVVVPHGPLGIGSGQRYGCNQ